MSDIANHMGISKRTLYENFTDKESLLSECLDVSIRQMSADMHNLVKESENVIDAMMRLYAKHLSEIHKVNKSVVYDLKKYHPRQYRKLEHDQKEGIDIFQPLFKKGIEQGLIREDINFEILIWLLKAQFKMLMETDFFPTEKYSISDFTEAIILSFVRGIATAQGNEKIDLLIGKIKNRK